MITEKGEARIQEIVDAAISEFIDKGYAKASMESIAGRAGISKGGLYHHFSSKMEILYMVNLRFLEPVQEFISKIETEGPVTDGLKNFISNYLNYWNEHRRELNLYFLIMNESFGNAEIMKLLRDSVNQYFDYFEDLYTRCMQQGIFKKIDSRSYAVSLISCLDGYLGYLMMDSFISTEKMISTVQNIFINNILK